MRIEPTSSIAATGDVSAVGRTPRAGAVDEAGAVQVSPSVSEIGRASTKNQTERAQHIARLKSAIAQGTYQVNREKLANSIAEEELARAGTS